MRKCISRKKNGDANPEHKQEDEERDPKRCSSQDNLL